MDSKPLYEEYVPTGTAGKRKSQGGKREERERKEKKRQKKKRGEVRKFNIFFSLFLFSLFFSLFFSLICNSGVVVAWNWK